MKEIIVDKFEEYLYNTVFSRLERHDLMDLHNKELELLKDEFIRDTEASIKRAYMKALEVGDEAFNNLHLKIGCSESDGDAVKEYLWNEYKGELK
tara:strand:- start:502 stop:786 length:285 start_codon:yes stop_codon:yes gene_type:complete